MIHASPLAGYLSAPLRPRKRRRTAAQIMAALGTVDRADDRHRRALLILSRVTCADVPHLPERVRWHVDGRTRLARRRAALRHELWRVRS